MSETWRDGGRIWKDIKDEERSRVLRLLLQMDLKEKKYDQSEPPGPRYKIGERI